MNSRIVVLLVIMFCLTFLVYGDRYENNIKRSFTINPHGTFQLSTQRGDIEIDSVKGNEITIEVLLKSDMKNQELDNPDILFNAGSNSVTVTTGKGLTRTSASVQFTVKIPESLAACSLFTMNGEVEIQGDYNKIDVKTYTGDIGFKGSMTDCILDSINGDIRAKIRKVLAGNVNIKSVNGDVNISLKEGSGFSIHLVSRTGTISSDFELVENRTLFGSSMQGVVEKGIYSFNVETVTGDIKLESN